jgi:protein-S-isoprenylcysteine O-methyltransferase Ste14
VQVRALLQIAFALLIVVFWFTRRLGEQRRQPITSTMVALLGAYLPLTFGLFPASESTVLLSIGNTLVAVGLLWNIVSLCYLGRAFGVLPDTRGLVTGGPYSIVRHPLYLGYLFTTVGFVLPALTYWTALAWCGWLAFQLKRIHYEEHLLQRTYPAYADYQLRTKRLLPAVW